MSKSQGLSVRQKLIEVGIPLDKVNEQSSREKHLSDGHPSSFHTWWARRPLSTCRALIFASLIDDPSARPEDFPTLEDQERERKRLFGLIADFSKWENIDQRTELGRRTITQARTEIAQALARARGHNPPATAEAVKAYLAEAHSGVVVHDPFAGGASIPIEAQRLGLVSVASDLNPIAVLINKALVEIPVEFQDREPISEPSEREPRGNRPVKWQGYSGISRDLRHYARWIRDEAYRHIGNLYPNAAMPDGTEGTVAAWIWVNTIPCRNPACGVMAPLTKSLRLSKARGTRTIAQPTVNHRRQRIEFNVMSEPAKFEDFATVNNQGATCMACGDFMPLDYVRGAAMDGNLREQLVAVAVERRRGKTLVSPTSRQEAVAHSARPPLRPLGEIQDRPLGLRVQLYGFKKWHQLFTSRQLTAVGTFATALDACEKRMLADGAEPRYARALRTFLAIAIGKLAQTSSRLARWRNDTDGVTGMFGRPTIGMIWNFGESNPFSNSAGNWLAQCESVAKVIERLPLDAREGSAFQADATKLSSDSNKRVFITDPPYYDNIGFADLSDFFYVWHKVMLESSYPELFLGVLSPKGDELISGPMFANPGARFERLMSEALLRLRGSCTDEFPSSIFYAYKQRNIETGDEATTAWGTFLSALSAAGFRIVATWPMRTEGKSRMTTLTRNSLSTSMVIVVRPRATSAPTVTRREFVAELESTLPGEIDQLIRNGVGPVDLPQAVIGPGMSVYTKYARIETIAGSKVPVGAALNEINRILDDYYRGEEGELDPETRFCRNWLDQRDFANGPYGDAEALALARDVSINELRDEHNIVDARSGNLRLLSPEEIELDENRPAPSEVTTAWEGCMRMVYHMVDGEGRRGIEGAADVAAAMGTKSEQVVRLCRILFNHYDRKFQPRNSRVYNDIVNHWPDIMRAARDESRTQTSFAA